MVVDGIGSRWSLVTGPYKKGTDEDYVGRTGLERHGKKKWQRDVADVVASLIAALEPDDSGARGRQRQEARDDAAALSRRR